MVEREPIFDFDAVFAGNSDVPSELKDDFDVEPVVAYGTHGAHQLVGHGSVTNVHCGQYRSYERGCLRVDLHNLVTLDGENRKGKIYRKTVRHFCNKPSCPVCFKSGWAVREAGNIEARLAEASERFGLVEHIVCSVPVRDYGLSYKALRKKVDKVLADRGIVGGSVIWHGFRYNLEKQWYWSPHFHVLGFIIGGYSRCRNCKDKWNCRAGCGGFDDRSYQKFLEDGYYIKVMGKRKTVFGTAWYQLNHSSIDVTKKRFHVATWFGVCSYRKMKVTVEKREEMCPICRHDLIDIDYHGSRRLDRDKRESFEDYEEDGRVVWFERQRKRYGSDSYGDD